MSSILHRNAAGTELYGALSNVIYRFSTTGTGTPVALNTLTLAGSIHDFTVDEQAARFYAIIGDGNVTLVPINGSAVTSWPLNQTWGAAVSYLPGSNYVLGGSDYSNGGGIRKYSRTNGSTLNDYAIDQTADSITYRGLATTPNGRTVYERRLWINGLARAGESRLGRVELRTGDVRAEQGSLIEHRNH